jgi:hypothetical protein
VRACSLILCRLLCSYPSVSVRAWRNLRRNQEYATKLERKKKKEQARLAAQEAAKPVKPTGPKSNPFAVCIHTFQSNFIN